jgi:hypothetical protein
MNAIQIKNSGYYNSLNNKVCMLREGQQIKLIGEADPADLKDSWKCLTWDGRIVFVEHECGTALNIA